MLLVSDGFELDGERGVRFGGSMRLLLEGVLRGLTFYQWVIIGDGCYFFCFCIERVGRGAYLAFIVARLPTGAAVLGLIVLALIGENRKHRIFVVDRV